MGANINFFREFVLAVQNKSQSGNSVTPTQFNIFANQATMSKFEADWNILLNTGNTSDFLKSYLKKVVKQVPPTGTIALPSDLQHTVDMRSYFIRKKLNQSTGLYEPTSVEVKVKESKNESWGDVQISSLLAPSARWPKYREFAREFNFLPKSIGTVYLDYLKTPTPALWSYTTTNNRPVYDPLTSVNFEWGEANLNEVAMLYLQLIGCNLSAPELVGFANQFKEQSKATL